MKYRTRGTSPNSMESISLRCIDLIVGLVAVRSPIPQCGSGFQYKYLISKYKSIFPVFGARRRNFRDRAGSAAKLTGRSPVPNRPWISLDTIILRYSRCPGRFGKRLFFLSCGRKKTEGKKKAISSLPFIGKCRRSCSAKYY